MVDVRIGVRYINRMMVLFLYIWTREHLSDQKSGSLLRERERCVLHKTVDMQMEQQTSETDSGHRRAERCGAGDTGQTEYYFHKLLKVTLLFSVVWNMAVFALTPVIMPFFDVAPETRRDGNVGRKVTR